MPSPQATPSLPVQCRKRKHYEISGLVKVEEPVKRTYQHSAQTEETNLWTRVKSYLENPAGRPQPLVMCPICTCPIAIRGIPILEPCPWKLACRSQMVGVVLPCAHVICQECYNGHWHAQEVLVPDGGRSCPICRAELLHSGCKHDIPPQRLPIATYEKASIVPLTRSEMQPSGGQPLPENCFDCAAAGAEEDVEVSMRFVSATVNGAGYLPGEGPPGWDDVVGAIQMAVLDFIEEQLDKPSWWNGSVPTGLLRVTFAGEAADLLQPFNHPGSDAIVYSREGEAFWYVPVRSDDGPE